MKPSHNSQYEAVKIQVLASCQGVSLSILQAWVDEKSKQGGKKTRRMNKNPLFSKPRHPKVRVDTKKEVFQRPPTTYSNLTREQLIDSLINS